ncbi:unnamed protein product [Rotaria sordida]|uniref:Uncharacterized protein n=1 Tax=Rotaria sordida TaxID=392033 RepID=A0A815NGF0_9BILA|nr:unnamed protein product [Rotaria sordida]CAF1436178.1 unnamed protein product [Rotaria sordida]
MLIFIGALVFYLELTLEQFTCAGPLAVWNVNPLLRGVPSLGNVAYFNALFPYVMLIVLIIREATLSGAIEDHMAIKTDVSVADVAKGGK